MIPCYYESQPGGCTKPHCPFLHTQPQLNVPPPSFTGILFVLPALEWDHVMSQIMRKSFVPYVNNKDADQPAHLHSLIGDFVVCCLDSVISLVAIPTIPLGSAVAQW